MINKPKVSSADWAEKPARIVVESHGIKLLEMIDYVIIQGSFSHRREYKFQAGNMSASLDREEGFPRKPRVLQLYIRASIVKLRGTHMLSLSEFAR